jgi:hypothetical protein
MLSDMAIRSAIFVLALCAVVVARVICPCVQAKPVAHAAATQAASDEHACCKASEPAAPESEAPAHHDDSCPHCKVPVHVVAADKGVDVHQLAPAFASPWLVQGIAAVDPAPSLSTLGRRADARIADPAPPPLRAVTGVFLI